MKRKWPLILLLACAAALVFAACARGGQAVQRQQYIVTFFDDELIVARASVSEGDTPAEVPAVEALWRDETGALVDPTSVPVLSNIEYHAWRVPAANTRVGALMHGEGSRFMPEETVTRAQAAELVCAMLPPDETSGLAAPRFSDIDGTPSADAIGTAAAMGLMSGYPDGTFRPDEAVTRAEFVSILCRMMGLGPSERDTGFDDVPAEHWAAGVISAAREAGWISGAEDGGFYPDTALSRAQAAAMAVRARGRQTENDEINTAVARTPFVDVLPTNWAYYEIVEAAYTNELLDYIIGQAEDMRPGFVLIDGHLCHVNAETLRLDRFDEGYMTVEEGLYHAAQAGYFIDRFSAGLKEFDDAMFYVPEDDGPFLTDDNYGYLYFGPDGRYTSGSAIIDEYAESLMAGFLHNSSLTQEQKLYKAYCVIRDGGYFYRSVPYTGWERGSSGWTITCAERMYTQKYGTCYYWASAFLYLARRLGYQAYAVCGGVGTRNTLHAWVVIDWDDGEQYLFDVELEWAYIHDFYHVTFITSNLFKMPRSSPNGIYVFPGESPTYYGVAEEEDYEDIIAVPEDYEPEEPDVPPEETDDPDAPPAETDDPDAPPEETDDPTAPPEESEPPVEPTPVPVEPTPVLAEPTPVPAEPTPVPAEPTPVPEG